MQKCFLLFMLFAFSTSLLKAQSQCSIYPGNFVRNYNFEEWLPGQIYPCDFPTICGDDYCDWWRAFGKPSAGMSQTCNYYSRNIALTDEVADYICGIYQNEFNLEDGDYQGSIVLINSSPLLVHTDELIIGMINNLDQSNISTEFIRKGDLPTYLALVNKTNISIPPFTCIKVPFSFTIINGQGFDYNQLFIYRLVNGNIIQGSIWIDNLIIKKKLIAFAGNDTIICKGVPVRLGGLTSPTAQGGMPIYTYNWTCSTSSWTSNASNPLVVPDLSTTYFLTVQDENGQGNIATDEITVIVDNDCPCLFPVIFSGSAIMNNGNHYSLNSIAKNPDESGNIVVAASISSNCLEISNGYSLCHSKPGGKRFVAKINNKGYTLWALIFEHGSFLFTGHSILTDEENNTFLLFNRYSDFENKFENGYNTTIIEPGLPSRNSFFIVKVNSLGLIMWCRVINDFGGDDALGIDFAISSDGIYVLGKTNNGFKLNEEVYPGGTFLLKLNKNNGIALWNMQIPPSNFVNLSRISIRDNYPYLETSYNNRQVYKINPLNGSIVLPVLSKPQASSSYVISTNYGGNNMFYDFPVDSSYASNYAIKSYKLETIGGKDVFSFKKSVEGTFRFSMGYSPINEIIYYQKEIIGANGNHVPDKFVKQNMLFASEPIWEKDISTYMNFIPSCTNSLPFGYFLANHIGRQGVLTLDQFDLQTSDFGCYMSKKLNSLQDKISLEQIKQYSEEARFIVYPNPVNDLLHVKSITEDISLYLTLKVIDIVGKTVKTVHSFITNDVPVLIDVSDLPSSIYILTIEDNRGNLLMNSRFIK